jgi:hypothetical protein
LALLLTAKTTACPLSIGRMSVPTAEGSPPRRRSALVAPEAHQRDAPHHPAGANDPDAKQTALQRAEVDRRVAQRAEELYQRRAVRYRTWSLFGVRSMRGV